MPRMRHALAAVRASQNTWQVTGRALLVEMVTKATQPDEVEEVKATQVEEITQMNGSVES